MRLYLVDESKMTIDEMKSELDLRGVDYEDCVSKQDLLERLRDTRTLGKADPNIFNKFNEMEDLDSQQMNELLDSDEVEEIKSKDGSLPGGMKFCTIFNYSALALYLLLSCCYLFRLSNFLR